MDESNKVTFQNSVFELLLFKCEGNEIVKELAREEFNKKRCLFYTETGINALQILPNSYIQPIYVDDGYDSIAGINDIPNDIKVYLVCNGEIENVKKLFYKENATFLSINDERFKIDKRIYQSKSNKILVDKKYKRKTLHIDRIDEFINYIVRCKIVFKIFESQRNINPMNIIAKPGAENPIPFIYFEGTKKYMFYEDKRDLDDSFFSANIDLNTKFFKLVFHTSVFNYERNELYFSLCQTTKTAEKAEHYPREYSLDKVRVDELKDYIEIFNEMYGSFFIDDFVPLYKYRKFEKTRYTKEEKVDYLVSPIGKKTESKDIELGNRTAFENGTIWFSTYKQLNDPFDLVVRRPYSKKISKKLFGFYNKIEAESYVVKDTNYLTFCTTSKSDNILMWSHYGDSHKGTCLLYPMIDILTTIDSDSECGICFYGKIKYSSNRPNFSMTFVKFRFIEYQLAVFRFNIVSMFNKFNDWKYEDEYRFLILPAKGEWSDGDNGHGMTLFSKQCFLGNKFPDAYLGYIRSFSLKTKKYNLSTTDYKLL